MIFTLIVALILAIVSVVFALQNSDVVEVVFFSLKMEGPFALFILASLVIGVVIGILVMVPGVIKNALTLSRTRKQVDAMQKSLKEQVPLAPPVTRPQAPASGVSLTDEPDQIEE